ncbi:MAG: sigma-70 family RNA polymerase sigma factor [Cyanobium sp.]
MAHGQPRKPPRPMTAAERQFAVRHLGLAQQQARRFAIRHQLDFEEVLGAAYEGLCKAALGFDPSLGFQPSSYVVPKVKGELLHHLRDTGFALRISHRYRELWVKARKHLNQELGEEQMAEALQVPIEVWLDVRLACGSPPLPLPEELGHAHHPGRPLP